MVSRIYSWRIYRRSRLLFHETSLAIAIGVDLRVELVHKTGLVFTCSTLVVVASSIIQVVAVDLAVVVAVNNSSTSTDTNTSGGTVTGQVVSIHLAIVVAIKRVLDAGSVGVVASDIVHVHLAVVVAVKRVVGASTVMVGGRLEVTVTSMLDSVCVVSRLVSETLSDTHTSGTADVLGDTLELIVTLLTAGKSSTLGLELIHSHGRQSGSLVVGGLVMVDLMDRDGGVHYAGLDSLLLNNGLDGLVDVVVNVLSANGRGNTLAVSGLVNTPLVSKAGLVINKRPLGSVGIAVVKLAVLNGTKLGSVLLGENLTVQHRLDGAVVVILVDLLVDGCVDLLVYVGLNDFVLNSGGYSLVDSGVMVTGAAHEVGDSCLGLVHFED